MTVKSPKFQALKMWIGNLDGARKGLVIATSKSRAMKVIPTGRADFESYWTLQPCPFPDLEPEVLYTTYIPPGEVGQFATRTWVRGRCKLPETKTKK